MADPASTTGRKTMSRREADDAALTLAHDALAAGLLSELRARGVVAVLVKGAAARAWLYPAGGRAPSVDIDIFVAPAAAARAAAVLRERGFQRYRTWEGRRPYEPQETEWQDRSGLWVDLHTRLWGITVDAAQAWQTFEPHHTTLVLAGRQVTVLDTPASALVCALRAAQDGIASVTGMEDLRRAIARAAEADWESAAVLAGAVGAELALSAGLRLLPEGAAVAERLELPDKFPVDLALTTASATPVARGLARLAGTAGLRRRIALIAAELVPRPDEMRSMYDIPRGRTTRLAAAYAWRPVSLARRLPRAARAYRKATRRERSLPRLHPMTVRAAIWAAAQARGVRRQLAAGSATHDVTIAMPPQSLPEGARRGVASVVHRTRQTCLVSSLVLQAWDDAHGRPRDVVIGTTAPSDGFQAHAWLDGEPTHGEIEFVEIHRLRPPSARPADFDPPRRS